MKNPARDIILRGENIFKSASGTILILILALLYITPLFGKLIQILS